MSWGSGNRVWGLGFRVVGLRPRVLNPTVPKLNLHPKLKGYSFDFRFSIGLGAVHCKSWKK